MNRTTKRHDDGGMREAEAQMGSIREMVKALEDAKDNDEAREKAEQTIHEDALSVEIRSDWANVGGEFVAGEYMILLSTGGPSCRIIGQLDDHKFPSTAEIQYQDWGTKWTRLPAEESILLTYAQCFYYGE